MKKIIENISKLPKWYGLIIVAVYGILTTEYAKFVFNIVRNSSPDFSEIIDTIIVATYVIGILTAFATWIVGSLIFHITALIFGGKQEWTVFLSSSAYSGIFLIVATIISIMLTENIQLNCRPEEIVSILQSNEKVRMASAVMDGSTVLCLCVITIFVHYLYNIKWYKAMLSVFLPTGTIYGICKIISIL